LSRALDFDGDGALGVLGGTDSRQFDPNVRSAVPATANGETEPQRAFSSGTKHYPLPAGVSEQPNIVLVTTDALSYGHTSIGGYAHDTTPNLAAWSRHATLFENAFALSTSTRLALPALHTGRTNSLVKMRKARRLPYPWDDKVTSIASMLRKKGYKTVFLPGGNYFLGRFRHGFEVADEAPFRSAKDKTHASPEITSAAIDYIERQPESGKPLFLWVHYYDHHHPYRLPKGGKVFGKNGRPVDLYDSELEYADRSWKHLFEAVESQWEDDEYLLIFTSDHGEAFDKQHTKYHHDFSIHSAVLHVPFVIQGPAQRGTRIKGLVSHADLMQTLSNIVGEPEQEEWIGESLLPSLFSGRAPEKDHVYSIFYFPEAV
jgi:arylsulfatase